MKATILPTPPREHGVGKLGHRFSVGHKVMKTENNHERDVYNGDIGFIISIHRKHGEMGTDYCRRQVTYPRLPNSTN